MPINAQVILHPHDGVLHKEIVSPTTANHVSNKVRRNNLTMVLLLSWSAMFASDMLSRQMRVNHL